MSTLTLADTVALLDGSSDAFFLVPSADSIAPANRIGSAWLDADSPTTVAKLLEQFATTDRHNIASMLARGVPASITARHAQSGEQWQLRYTPRANAAALLVVRPAAPPNEPGLADSPDLTHYTDELRIARDKALAAQRAKTAFLSNLSHELRTPLNAIIGYSDLLQEGGADRSPTEIALDARKINAAGQHLLALVDDVLELSRLESGKLRTVIAPIHAAALIRGVVDQFSPCTQPHDNRIEVAIASDLGEIVSDAGRVRQILFALLSNANKFTQHGLIKVIAKIDRHEDQPALIVTISDTGVGIKPEQQGALFDAFSQGDDSPTRLHGGLGIGLALTNRLCRILGGSLHLRSESPGGTTATVCLPLATPSISSNIATEWFAIGPKVDPAAVRLGPAQQPHDERRSKVSCVLVIDDDANVRDLMERFLTRQGYDAISAANGTEGLELARQTRPDIITLDVMMPHKDGWQVLREIKSDPLLAATPVIMLTQVADANLCFTLGAADYLRKPVDPQLLAQTINNHARIVGPRRAAQDARL